MRNNVVVVVEDEPSIRDMMRTMIEGMLGVATVPAEDGREALQRVRDLRPALVVLDIMLPEMDGLEVARQLKAYPETRAIPLLAVSALGNVRAEAVRAGCVDFVAKPFELDHFIGKVRKHMSPPVLAAAS